LTLRQILLLTHDVVGEHMAGSGIRFWEFARVLDQHFDVTLATAPLGQERVPESVVGPGTVRIWRGSSASELSRLVQRADVIVASGPLVAMYPFLAASGKPLVVDCYDPFLLTGLQQHRHRPMSERWVRHERYRVAHVQGLRAADLVLCASERQKDYWLGMLSALGRINPSIHAEDAAFSSLVRVVPFGLPGQPPQHTCPALKGVWPGIGDGDKVVLWNGGIWDWFDAETAVRAMALIAEVRQDVRLFFMGQARPNATVSRPASVADVIRLSEELGLLDRYVMFHDWVPYQDRQNYLLEADVGISLHEPSAEVRFSFRTRLLDCVWAALPVVATEGDVLGEELAVAGLAHLVAPRDPRAVATAILTVLDAESNRDDSRARAEPLRARYRWTDASQPLIDFCKSPRVAPDKKRMRGVRVVPRRRLGSWLPPRLREAMNRNAFARFWLERRSQSR
jgi:hypothetical protein